MNRSENVVITNLCMIEDEKGNILVQDRVDQTWPGICFPGGHVELGESFHDAVVREVKEETGLTISHPKLCGVKQFMRDDQSRYLVLFYRTKEYSGTLCDSEEGKVFWISKTDLPKYSFASDFDVMLEVFESEDLSEFYYERHVEEENDWKIKLY